MSAYYVGFHHVNALLSALVAPTRPGTFNRERSDFYAFSVTTQEMIRYSLESERDLTALGAILLYENARSLQSRYPGDDMVGEETADTYTFAATTTDRLTPEACLKGLDCYDYQACETRDYQGTQAAHIVYAMRKIFTARIKSVKENHSGYSFDELATAIPKAPARREAVIRTRTRRIASRRIESV